MKRTAGQSDGHRAAQSGDGGTAPVVVDDVEDLLGDCGEADVIQLFRWDPALGKWAYLDQRTPGQLAARGVREDTSQRLGGGRYRGRIRRHGGAWGMQRDFAIDGEPRPLRREESSGVAVIPSGGTAAPSSGPAPPAWLERMIMPIATAAGAYFAKKLLEDKPTDPVLLKLLELQGKSARGDSVDPIELQRLILEAEARGETRGKTIGELTAGAGSGSGIGDAVRDAMPLFQQILAMQQPTNVAPAPRRLETPRASDAPRAATPAPDIAPEWLRPFLGFRRQLLNLADRGADATLYADLVVDSAGEATIAAIAGAESVVTLEADLFAAVPELTASDARRVFVHDLITAVRDAIAQLSSGDAGGDEEETA